MTKYFMQSKLFESILKEAKDYKFKAKVGDFWLQKDGKGWRLCDDKAEADEFESETEPKQSCDPTLPVSKGGMGDSLPPISLLFPAISVEPLVYCFLPQHA